MAQSFISEIGDQLGGDGVANTEGEHVKIISAEYYKRIDNDVVSNVRIQDAISSTGNGKVVATDQSSVNSEFKLLATASASPTSGALTEAVYDTGITMNPSTNTLTANLAGTATSAGKLTTARKAYVALGTASSSSTFDWSGDTVLPINGTLAVGHGGTGKTSVTANNFLVGNGTSALVEKTPAQVLSLIGAVSSSSLANVAFNGKYSSLLNKPSLTNESIRLNANTTIYVSINYIFNAVNNVGSLLTNVNMKGGTYAAWNNDSIVVLHSIGSDVVGVINITNHILSCTLKSDIEFSYYLSSAETLTLKLKNNTSNDYRVSVSATVLDSSDSYPNFYKITEIDADTTAIAQSGTATNVWCNHALVSEKIGKTNSATTGIDYTSKGNTSTPIYLDNGEFKECTSISTPYEWVTTFPTTYTAGKVYLL